jgi:beta-N-acetylhexosaminidase
MDAHNSRSPLAQLIMAGLPATELDQRTLTLIREYGVGNFILFTRNVGGGRDQTRRLCEEIKDACLDAGLPPAIIAVDQEGGRVQRLGPPDWPRIAGSGEIALSADPVAAVQAQAHMTAGVLAPLGIGLNLAPVLDLAPPGTTGVMEERSYGMDPDRVASLGASYIRILQSRGIGATAKHFPGIGRVRKDPHYRRPVVQVSRAVLIEELEPFRRAAAEDVCAIMTSHVVYDAVDSSEPATFSRAIAEDLLRYELGFKGVLLTDDLEMGGITGYGKLDEAAVKAVLAGHDLLLVCHEASRVREAISGLSRAWSCGDIPSGRLNQALERLSTLRQRIGV